MRRLLLLLLLLHYAASAALFGPYPTSFDVVPPELYTLGVKHLGRSPQTRALVRRVASGQATTWLLLGGSVTHRNGGCTHSLINDTSGDARAACCGLSKVGEGVAGQGLGWARHFIDWLNEAHPVVNPSGGGGGGHVLLNAGVISEGNSPTPYLSCWWHALAPVPWDAVLLDFHGFDSYNRVRDPDLELLVRRLLNHRPDGVVMSNPMFDWDSGGWDVQDKYTSTRLYGSLLRPWPLGRNGGGFEDDAQSVMQYYNCPCLSFRNMMYNFFVAVANNASAAGPADASRGWDLTDERHYRLLNGTGQGELLPNPHTGDLWDGVHILRKAQHAWGNLLIHWLRLTTLIHEHFDDAEAVPSLPAPLELPGHWIEHCFASRKQLDSIIKATSGDVRMRDYSTRQGDPKWGYVAEGPQASLTMVLDTAESKHHKVVGNANASAAVTPFIGVELIHSHWAGDVQLSCVSGCVCQPVVVQCASEHYTLPKLATISVSASSACLLRVTALTNGTRFVITAVNQGVSLVSGAVPSSFGGDKTLFHLDAPGPEG